MVSPTLTPSANPHASSMKFPNVCVSLVGTASPSFAPGTRLRIATVTVWLLSPAADRKFVRGHVTRHRNGGRKMEQLDGRTAVVTGSGSGIGRAIIRELA